MAESNSAEASRPSRIDDDGGAETGSTPRTFWTFFALKKGSMRVASVVVAAAVMMVVLSLLVISALHARLSYAEERNLRELDRIANSVVATTQMLSVISDLHFVPSQLHFSLAPRSGCLLGKAAIPSSGGSTIDLTYHFVDPAGAVAAMPPGGGPPAPASAAEQGLSAPLASERCTFKVVALPLEDDVDIRLSEREISASHHLPIADLFKAMALSRSGSGGIAGDCGPNVGESVPPATPVAKQAASRTTPGAKVAAVKPGPSLTGGPTRQLIARCFRQKAEADLARSGIEAPEGVVLRSIATAFASATVKADARTDAATLGLEPSLALFDAVTILAPPPADSHSNEPVVKLQAGEVPPFVGEGVEQMSSEQVLRLLVGGGERNAPPVAADKSRQRGGAAPDPSLAQASIRRVGNLLVFEKSYAFLGQLKCSHERPCRIMGIVSESRLNKPVRTLRGTEATIFLIGLLALIGCLPLVHLALRKRLDPIGRTVQYVMWFSLTLLAASAMVASLTVWTQYVSRIAGQQAAEMEGGRIRAAFAKDVDQSLKGIARRLPELGRSRGEFPLPGVAPLPGVSNDGPAGRPSGEPRYPDTLAYFNGDGSEVRDRLRVADLGFPAYGLNIADRSYFRRATAGDLVHFGPPALCQTMPLGKRTLSFTVDRVIARPDGAAKTIFLLPTQQPCLARFAPPPARGELPATPPFLVGAGFMKAFMRGSDIPGLQYAVLDPGRPRAEADVLFHSQHESELVERFERELGSPAAFAAELRELESSTQDTIQRLATDYRGQPVALSISKLHSALPWILVMVENRDDASFAAWRAALFGFVTWLTATMLLALVMLVARLRNPESLDRRPGLWVWPREILDDFTPPRFSRDCTSRERLVQAAAARDRHLLWITAAGLLAIMASEGASRSLFALSLVFAASSARAYFRGRTATNRASARRLDRSCIMLAWLFLLASFVAMIAIVGSGGHETTSRGFLVIRMPLFLFGVAVVALRLIAAARCAFRGDPPLPIRTIRRTPHGWMLLLVLIGATPAAAGYLDSRDQDYYLVAEHRSQLALKVEQQCTDLMRATLATRFEVVGDAPTTPPSCLTGRDRVEDGPEYEFTLSGTAMKLVGQHERALDYSDQPSFHVSEGFKWEKHRKRYAVSAAFLFALPLLLLLLALIYFRRHYFRRSPAPAAADDPQLLPPLTCSRESFVSNVLVKAAEQQGPVLPFEPTPGRRHLILGVDLDIREQPELHRVDDRIGWVDLLDVAATDSCNCTFDAKVNVVVIGNLDIALQLPGKNQIERTFTALAAIIGEAGRTPSPRRHIFILADIEPLDRIALLRSRTSEEADSRLIGDWRWAALLQDFALCVVSSRTACAKRARAEAAAEQAAGTLPHALSPDERRAALTHVAERELQVINLHFGREVLEGLRRNIERVHPSPRRRKAAPAADELLAGEGEPGGPLLWIENWYRRRRAEAAAEDSSRALGTDASRLIGYIAEQLADYYHKLWASSGDEERVILYHLAWRRHLKMGDSRAVRSLLTRGLIVRTPEYRLMNRSFARYVRRVERTELIERRARRADGLDAVWPLLRYPLAGLVASLVVLLKLAAPEGNTGAVALIPAIGAVIPSLFSNLLRFKGNGS